MRRRYAACASAMRQRCYAAAGRYAAEKRGQAMRHAAAMQQPAGPPLQYLLYTRLKFG